MNVINKIVQLAAAIWVKIFYSSIPNKIDGKKNIALIRPDAIGDFLIFIQYAHNLRIKYPKKDYSITLFSHPGHEELSKKYLDIDTFVAMDATKLRNSVLDIFQYMKQNRDIKFDEVIMCPYSRDWMSDCFVFSLDSNLKTGWNGDNANINPYLKKISNLFYNDLKTPSDELRNTPNEYRFNENFFGPKKVFSNQDKINRVAIFIGASWGGRIWPTHSFTQLIERLQAKKLPIVLLGGPSDVKKASSILEMITNQSNIKNLVGKTTLEGLIYEIEQSKLLITTESSAMHAASLTETETIVIMGGGHFGRFNPNSNKCHIVNHFMDCYHCNWDCPYYKHGEAVPCIEKITVTSILDKVNNCLLS